MSVDGKNLILTVEPNRLATRLELEHCWTCVDTDDAAQKETKFLRAVHTSDRPPAEGAQVQHNDGLRRGKSDGSFITGDLCPSRKPLDRRFLEKLGKLGPRTPVALAITGLWLETHVADFRWLQAQARSGALAITWVNHSFHHPYRPGRPNEANFLLTPGVDLTAEILDTERLLVANGETPSIFFRFPGLVSDGAAIETVRKHHLVVLGANGWLALGPMPQPAQKLPQGTILLVHPNGNEPEGLDRFMKARASETLPQPFRPIEEAP